MILLEDFRLKFPRCIVEAPPFDVRVEYYCNSLIRCADTAHGAGKTTDYVIFTCMYVCVCACVCVCVRACHGVVCGL